MSRHKTPEFIAKMKEFTVRTTARKKLYVRAMVEQRDRLKEISTAEHVSEAKLIEFAIDALYDKWSAESGRKKAS